MNRATSDRRLLKLADFLEKLPRERFDYGIWVGLDWQGAQDLSCGTTACALGWAATMPEFQRLGLRLERTLESGPVSNRKLGAMYPALAAMLTFGLSHAEESHVFEGGYLDGDLRVPTLSSLDGDPSPKQVARHIRRFVKARANAV